MGMFFRHVRMVLLLCATATVASTSTAQRAESFSVIEVRLSEVTNLHSGALHAHWNLGNGLELAFATPIPVGFLELGTAVHRYEPRVGRPGLTALWLYAGWGGRLRVADWFGVSVSARLGNYRMTFDDEEAEFRGVLTESELGRMFASSVDLQISGPLSIIASAGHIRVYTRQRLSLWFASAGLRYKLRTPEGLKTFLR